MKQVTVFRTFRSPSVADPSSFILHPSSFILSPELPALPACFAEWLRDGGPILFAKVSEVTLMPSYDFKNISPLDFEVLCRDLLSAQFGVDLQVFKAGRDQGVDLLHSFQGKDNIVVQCKHFARSSYSHLKTSLKNDVPKIQKLAPNRYVIATSLPLSKANKEDIRKLFGNYINDISDIYGLEQLNALLGKYPHIEKAHFKLWIASTTVLQQIINNGIFRGTEIALEKIIQRVPLYVQNESFHEACQILDSEHVCVISGNPGIGKTTLANMLSLHYTNEGFEFIQIQSDIGEARDVDGAQSKRVYYYDDFLGQTSLDQKLGKNEDQALLDFIEHIRRSNNKRFILTTRQYILNQVRLRYEKMEREFEVTQCVIDLKSYTKYEKAKILYNHVYFSPLPLGYRQALLADKSYLKIIEHPNYNPRLLEYMTMRMKRDIYSESSYVHSFLSTLDHPEKIWTEAFGHHLGEVARQIAMFLLLFQDGASFEDLKEIYIKSHPEVHHLTESILKDGLKELEGNFISIQRYFRTTNIRFQNPSVRDFLEDYVLSNKLIVNLIGAAVTFEQLIKLWDFSFDRMSRAELTQFISTLFALIRQKKNFSTEARLHSLLDVLRKSNTLENYLETIIEIFGWYDSLGESNIEELAPLLASMANEEWKSKLSKQLTQSLRERLLDLYDFNDIKAVANYQIELKWILQDDDWSVVRESFIYYVHSNLRRDLLDINELDDLESLRSDIKDISRSLDESVSSYEIDVREDEIRKRQEEDDHADSEGWSSIRAKVSEDISEEEAIDKLFSSLLEP